MIEELDEYAYERAYIYTKKELGQLGPQTYFIAIPIALRTKLGLTQSNTFDFEIIIRKKK